MWVWTSVSHSCIYAWGKRGKGGVPSNADGKGAVFPRPSFYDGHLAAEEAAWTIQDLVRVAVVVAGMRVRRAIVRMRVCHVGQSL